ncbi:hypothetical protein [Rufibacter sp. LB8]|nr:hypothetical protein [Rufibacter sp. LB8]
MIPFLQKSHAYAARVLHAAGLTVAQIPVAVNVTRETVETWLDREVRNGNLAHAAQVLKGQVQEKAPKILFHELKELVLVRLMIHLGIRSNLAASVAALILPFVLKRVSEMARQNPALQTWWQEQTWRQHLPTAAGVKNKLRQVSQNFTSKPPTDSNTLTL